MPYYSKNCQKRIFPVSDIQGKLNKEFYQKDVEFKGLKWIAPILEGSFVLKFSTILNYKSKSKKSNPSLTEVKTYSMKQLKTLKYEKLKRFNFDNPYNINLSDLYQTISEIFESSRENTLSQVTKPIYVTNSPKTIEVNIMINDFSLN